ncbi:MAG: DUF1275 domain-containing protein [Bacilli bacterium]|nr:DUF1275 domain-containing protein [Bacilli bacterium]
MKKRSIIELIIALLFAFCGGFSDAYTLQFRGGLYSNMQTGNLVKFFMNLADGKFAPSNFFPIIFFCLGILFAVLLTKWKHRSVFFLAFLIAVSLGSAFIPNGDVETIIALCVLSVAGAVQFECFRECLSITYTSTMCTNNMRLLVENAVGFVKDKKNKTVFFFLSVILVFGSGAAVSVLSGKGMHEYSITIISGIYLVILVLLLLSKFMDKKENQETIAE